MLLHRLNLLNNIQLQIEMEKGIFTRHFSLDNFKEMILQIKNEDGQDVVKNSFNHLSFVVFHCLSPRF